MLLHCFARTMTVRRMQAEQVVREQGSKRLSGSLFFVCGGI